MNERVLAYKILYQFQLSLDRIDKIENIVLKNLTLNQNQYRYIRNVVSGVLRHLSLLDWYISKLYQGNFSKLILKAKTILRIGLYEFLFMPQVPDHATVNECVKIAKKKTNLKTSKLINAILRSCLRQKEELNFEKEKSLTDNFETTFSFPSWLVKRWIKIWGKEFVKKLCISFNELPVFNIRVNQSKITPQKFEEILIENEIEFVKSRFFSGCYQVAKIREIMKARLFNDGLCSVQNESAMIPINLFKFKKGDTFLDVCSAPGGKFTQVLEKEETSLLVVAVDENIERLKRVKENLKRLALNGMLVAADANNLPFKIQFSNILIDAPCTGQGVIGKHPDIKWRRLKKDIKAFALIQKSILQSVSKFVKNNGHLVYSTCSIDPEENEEIIESFLSENEAEFEKVESTPSEIELSKIQIKEGFIRTFPNNNKLDGSFACLLKKKS